MVKRLAIDPGYSNGWALFNQDEWIMSGVYYDAELIPAIAFWVGLAPDRVIIERIPTFGHGVHARRLEHVLLALDIAFPHARWILPGWWKPIAGKYPLPVKVKTEHEKDAIRMVLFDIRVPG